MLWQYCASHANKAHLNLRERERKKGRRGGKMTGRTHEEARRRADRVITS